VKFCSIWVGTGRSAHVGPISARKPVHSELRENPPPDVDCPPIERCAPHWSNFGPI
jgi:hypothetical protein